MRDSFVIGPTPHGEGCAQVGEFDYRRKALAECRRFIQLIRETLGPESEGAELGVTCFGHDLGDCCEDEAPARMGRVRRSNDG